MSTDKHAQRTEKGSHQIEPIVVEQHALEQAASFLQTYKRVMIVADDQTYRVAGEPLGQHLNRRGIEYRTSLLPPNAAGDVVADERTMVQVLLDINNDVDVLVAVGSGTIHDIVRFISSKVDRPFISVPTAASVDGFTSAGAPLIIQGVKKTIQCGSPIALFADLDILVQAPRAMTAAGFADMLGKYTSLADWRFSYVMNEEPYDLQAAQITRKSLMACVEHVHQIAAADTEGIRVLMHALIDSGLAMLQVGHSRPASGAEHHLSHYWEMDGLRRHHPQKLHGAKVGVATAIIADLYRQISQLDSSRLPNEVKEPVKKEKNDRPFQECWSEIQEVYAHIPSSSRMKEWLEKVGGPSTPEQLGIGPQLVQQALQEAHHLRDRYTGLKWVNEHHIWDRLHYN